MSPRTATTADLDWLVAALAARRGPLVEHAPVFWRPAPDADTKHRDFLEFLLTDGGAKAYRTDASVLIAAPRGDTWVVDDMSVPTGDWAAGDGRDLWNLLATETDGAAVRFVSSAYESDSAVFAQAVGLSVGEPWWLLELATSGGEAGVEVDLQGATAVTVGSPPVYAPPGPMLFLPESSSEPAVDIPAAVTKAETLGCAGVAVNVAHGDDGARAALTESGFRRHCDFYIGALKTL